MKYIKHPSSDFQGYPCDYGTSPPKKSPLGEGRLSLHRKGPGHRLQRRGAASRGSQRGAERGAVPWRPWTRGNHGGDHSLLASHSWLEKWVVVVFFVVSCINPWWSWRIVGFFSEHWHIWCDILLQWYNQFKFEKGWYVSGLGGWSSIFGRIQRVATLFGLPTMGWMNIEHSYGTCSIKMINKLANKLAVSQQFYMYIAEAFQL